MARAAARVRAGAAHPLVHRRARDGGDSLRGRARATRSSCPRTRSSPRRTRSCCAARAPVFVDIRRDTLNLDERLIEAAITPRTKAIVPVHYAGVAVRDGRDHGHRAAPRPAGDRGRGAGAALDLARPRRRAPSAHLGCLSLPRDQERDLPARAARCSSTIPRSSSAPRSSARRAPTAASSSAARSTSTPGWTSARRSCRASSWAPTSAAQLEHADEVTAWRRAAVAPVPRGPRAARPCRAARAAGGPARGRRVQRAHVLRARGLARRPGRA